MSQCSALTNKNARCTRASVSGTNLCKQHTTLATKNPLPLPKNLFDIIISYLTSDEFSTLFELYPILKKEEDKLRIQFRENLLSSYKGNLDNSWEMARNLFNNKEKLDRNLDKVNSYSRKVFNARIKFFQKIDLLEDIIDQDQMDEFFDNHFDDADEFEGKDPESFLELTSEVDKLCQENQITLPVPILRPKYILEFMFNEFIKNSGLGLMTYFVKSDLMHITSLRLNYDSEEYFQDLHIRGWILTKAFTLNKRRNVSIIYNRTTGMYVVNALSESQKTVGHTTQCLIGPPELNITKITTNMKAKKIYQLETISDADAKIIGFLNLYLSKLAEYFEEIKENIKRIDNIDIQSAYMFDLTDRLLWKHFREHDEEEARGAEDEEGDAGGEKGG